MPDVTPTGWRRLRPFRVLRRRGSVLSLCLLAFFLAGTLDVVWAAPPRRPAKRAAPQKPPSKRAAKKSATAQKKGTAKKPVAKKAKKSTRKSTTGQKGSTSRRRTVSGVRGTGKASAQRARASQSRRKPISLEKKADVKARLDRLRQQSVRGAGTKLPVPRPGLKFNKKDIRQQMAKRGWTEQLVRATRDNPVKVVETRDIRRVKGLPGRRYEPATAYYSARGGYIVVNNRTGEVVQVSDRTKPDWKTRLFRPRSDPR